MPRSLAACMNEVVRNLQLVANEQSDETLRRAGRLRADLQYGRIDEILATGLHAYLTQFLERVNDLGAGISRDFLVPGRALTDALADKRRGPAESLNVDPRRAQPRHALPLRPAGHARAAGRAAAAGAAFAARAILSYSLRSSRPSTSSTGSRIRRQLPRAPRLPGADDRASGSRSTWSPRWRSSTRSTSSSSRAPRSFPFAYERRAAARARAVPAQGAGDAAASTSYLAAIDRSEQRDDRLPGRAQPAAAEGHRAT